MARGALLPLGRVARRALRRGAGRRAGAAGTVGTGGGAAHEPMPLTTTRNYTTSRDLTPLNPSASLEWRSRPRTTEPARAGGVSMQGELYAQGSFISLQLLVVAAPSLAFAVGGRPRLGVDQRPRRQSIAGRVFLPGQ